MFGLHFRMTTERDEETVCQPCASKYKPALIITVSHLHSSCLIILHVLISINDSYRWIDILCSQTQHRELTGPPFLSPYK